MSLIIIEGCEAFIYAYTIVCTKRDLNRFREALYRRIDAMNAEARCFPCSMSFKYVVSILLSEHVNRMLALASMIRLDSTIDLFKLLTRVEPGV